MLHKPRIFLLPLMKIIYNRNISRHPRVRSIAYALESSFTLLQVSCQSCGLKSLELGCMPCPTLEFWQLHRHLHHPTRSARPIRNSFLSCIPSPGTAPALGVEGMQSWGWNLCLHRLEMNLQCGKWLRICIPCAWDTSAICIQVSALGALWGGSSPCLQADPKVPLMSSHLCCLIPPEALWCFLRHQSFPGQAL